MRRTVHVYVCMCMCAYVCMCVYACMCAYVCIAMHTRTPRARVPVFPSDEHVIKLSKLHYNSTFCAYSIKSEL